VLLTDLKVSFQDGRTGSAALKLAVEQAAPGSPIQQQVLSLLTAVQKRWQDCFEFKHMYRLMLLTKLSLYTVPGMWHVDPAATRLHRAEVSAAALATAAQVLVLRGRHLMFIGRWLQALRLQATAAAAAAEQTPPNSSRQQGNAGSEQACRGSGSSGSGSSSSGGGRAQQVCMDVLSGLVNASECAYRSLRQQQVDDPVHTVSSLTTFAQHDYYDEVLQSVKQIDQARHISRTVEEAAQSQAEAQVAEQEERLRKLCMPALHTIHGVFSSYGAVMLSAAALSSLASATSSKARQHSSSAGSEGASPRFLVSSDCQQLSGRPNCQERAVLAGARSPAECLAVLLSCAELQQVPQALQVLGARLCGALPISCACNNPACNNLARNSELQLVQGKGSQCSGCKVAR
jgi:hypothetical protein